MSWIYQQKPPMGWPLDLSEPINNGLVGYWYMPEGSGKIVQDLSGNGGTGTLTDIIWKAGKYGSVVNSAGTSGVINLPSSYTPIDGATEFTLIIQLTPTLITSDGFLFDTNGGVAMKIDTGGVDDWVFFVSDGTDSVKIGDDDSIPVVAYNGWGVPVNLAMVFKANDTLKVYIDGIKWGTEGDASSVDFVASTADNYRFFNIPITRDYQGDIEFAYLYNRALSASEIALLSQFPFYGFLNPDEVPVLDQYYTVGVGNAGIMTPNTGYWGPTF